MNDPEGIATVVIIAITALVSYRAFKSRKLIDLLVFSPADILRDHEYHRLMTCGLIHADWMHLLFNMFSLYSFGCAVDVAFGYRMLLLIYLSSILGGSLLSLYLHRQQNDYRALGASGGVCGVIFASIFLLPGGSVIIFPLPIAIPSWLYAFLFIFVSFFGMRRQAGNIGHDAHLGGALCGLILATAIHPEIMFDSPVLYLTVVTISLVLLLYTCRYPLHSQTSNLFTKHVGRDLKSMYKRKSIPSDNETLDRLRTKVMNGGVDCLSASERKQLRAISKRKK